MNTLLICALLGSAIIGGVFFAFSSFVMPALYRLPGNEGLRAMQSINKVVINPWFMTPFLGTTILSLAIIILSTAGKCSFLAATGPALYIFGVFMVTAFGNVPLNNQLETMATEQERVFWKSYYHKWTSLNHIRTLASILSTVLMAIELTN